MNSRGLSWLLDWSGVVGVALLALGILLGSVLLGWTVVPLIFIGVGVFCSLLWLLSHRQLLAEVSGLRSTQTNTNIVISAVSFLVILVLLNGLAVRFNTPFDLTEGQFFTLSSQTTQVIEGLQQPVKVWWVSTDPAPSVRESLERYRSLNPDRFEFELLNPRKSPLEAERLQVTRNDVLVVESGERKQELPQPPLQDLESQLTPLILKVVDTQSLTVYLVQGHGEIPLTAGAAGQPSVSQAVTALEQDGFEVEELSLVGDQPAPADGVIVVAGPERGFLPGEADKLQEYLAQGGKLALLLNPQTDPQLDPLLEDWGIVLQQDVIVDRLSEALFRSGPFVALGSSYGSHPITTDLSRQQIVTLFPLARSLGTESVQNTTVTALVMTNPQGSWGETSIDLGQRQTRQPEFDPDEDIEGPLTLAIAASREVEAPDTEADQAETEGEETDDQPREARLVVFGNANFVVDGNLTQQGNRDLFLNAVNWLADQGDRISIRPKTPTNRRLTLTPSDIAALRLVALLGLPVLALSTGIAIWWQRR